MTTGSISSTRSTTTRRRQSAIIADDLTGACDVGAQFAQQGFTTSVLFISPALKDLKAGRKDLLVFDTETRNARARVAYQRMRILGSQCKTAGVDVVYKKMDSTFRGNVGAELDALLDVFRELIVVVCPTYPEYHRTVVNGSLLIDGMPVDRTEFANDPLSPVRLADTKELVRLQTKKSIGCIYLPVVRKGSSHIAATIRQFARNGTRILCTDAENRADLRNIADACNQAHAMPCGSAGLAAELAAGMEVPRSGIMVLSASTNSATMSELRRLARSSIPMVRAKAEALIRQPKRKNEVIRVRNQALRAIQTRGVALVCSALHPRDLRRSSLNRPRKPKTRDPIASGLAKAVSPLVLSGNVRGILVTGGEMAAAFLSQINATELSVEAEILPGIAVCTVASGRAAGLKVVTKAGGFGAPGSMGRLLQYLRRASEVRMGSRR